MTPAAFAELDLGALEHNLSRLREAAPRAKVMAVIKANAYGHGMVRVASALPTADAFAVARLDEGVALREAGIRQRIVVLQGFICPEELELHARFDLEPVIHSVHQIDLLEQHPPRDARLGAWVKLDTGMHRLGLDPAEFRDCYQRLSGNVHLKDPLPIMTHLANADVVTDTTTERQLAVFNGVASDPVERVAANSAGLLAWPASHAEWVRPGLALYGVSPFPFRSGAKDGFRPVMTLKTRLIAIKNLRRGDPVGYGGDWICPHPTRMGIASIGYGDGYPRSAASGTPVLVNEQSAPLIGRVSMDMITVDLSEHPQARVGDTVTLWGQGLPVEEVARHANTIPYVLLCNVTQRVRMIEQR
ncbi:alanine racemase [Methylolobus aquaticus]|nr:alanine racemase [Methylolobus aquaticus]